MSTVTNQENYNNINVFYFATYCSYDVVGFANLKDICDKALNGVIRCDFKSCSDSLYSALEPPRHGSFYIYKAAIKSEDIVDLLNCVCINSTCNLPNVNSVVILEKTQICFNAGPQVDI